MSALGNGAGPQTGIPGLELIQHRPEQNRRDADAVFGLCDAAAALTRNLNAPLHRLVLRSGDCAVELEFATSATGSDTSIRVGSEPAGSVDQAVAPPVAVPAGSTVRAPLVGTFYAASAPGAEPFVRVGDLLAVGATIGIVEAMKLMNPVVTEVAGTVVEVLAQDGASVEYDQPLIVLDPGQE